MNEQPAVIVNQANFLLQAMQLMQSYYKHREEGDTDEAWMKRPLIENAGGFMLSGAEMEERFSDVIHYLRSIRQDAATLLSTGDRLAALFGLSVGEGKQKEYFLSGALMMAADANDVSLLSRERFASACLMSLDDISGLHDEVDEARHAVDFLQYPDYSMDDIFNRVNSTLLSDADRMVMLRFFRDMDSYYEEIVEKLSQLQSVCRKHFPLIESRFEKRAALYREQGEASRPIKWLYGLLKDARQIIPHEPIHLAISPVLYNLMGCRVVADLPINKLVLIGLIFDDLEDLEKTQKRRQDSTEEQLKAIADPTRLAIVRLLSQRAHYVQELADTLKLTPATLSHHLKALLRAGLVSAGIEGRRSYYSLNPQELSGLAQDLLQMAGAVTEETL